MLLNSLKPEDDNVECPKPPVDSQIRRSLSEMIKRSIIDEPFEPVIKIASEAPNVTDYTNDIEACRLKFEEYIRYRQENIDTLQKEELEFYNSHDKYFPKFNGILQKPNGLTGKPNGLLKKEKTCRESYREHEDCTTV